MWNSHDVTIGEHGGLKLEQSEVNLTVKSEL